MLHKAIKLGENETLQLAKDARLVGMRWDVIPWSLVLDLDAPLSEGARAPMRRAWLVFRDISELSFPFVEARLPDGCWLSSPITCAEASDGFIDYTFIAIIPHFIGNALEGKPSKKVLIRAKAIIGIASSNQLISGEQGLTWKERVGLATDEELV